MSSAAPRPPRLLEFAVPLAPAFLAALLYAPALDAPFLYDDLLYVVENPQIRELREAPALWTSACPRALPRAGLYRPLAATTYALDHAVFGLDPRGFHATNVLAHAAASAALALLVRRLGGSPPAALLTGLLFAAHAVHTEAVSWVVGRAEVLAAVFAFLSALAWAAYRRTGRKPPLGAACAAYFFALASKETAAPLPAAILAGDLLRIFRRPARAAALLRPHALFGLAFAGYALLRLVALGRFGVAPGAEAFAGDPAATRWATALAGLWRSARLVVVPSGLRVHYEDLKVEALLDPRVALGVGTVLGLLVAAFGARRRYPEATFAAIAFALFLLPVSHFVVPIGAVFGERFLYLPSASACALLGVGLARGLRRGNAPGRRAAFTAAVVLLGYGAATIVRNRDWGDAERFWRKALAQSPRNEKAHLQLADLLRQRGALDECESVLRAGIALRPEGPGPVTSDHATIVLRLAEFLRERGRAAEALPLYEKRLALFEAIPGFRPGQRAGVLGNYALALDALGRFEDGIAALEEAIALRPENADAWVNLGILLVHKGDREGGVARFERAIELASPSALARYSLGVTLLGLGRREAAAEALAESLALGEARAAAPLAEASRALHGEALATGEEGRADDALARLARAGAGTAEDLAEMGRLSERLGQAARARRHYREALALDPGHGGARAALERLRESPR